MITIFTLPKPFIDHNEVIQRNAIQSWLQLGPSCQVILLGDDAGVKEAADEFGVEYLANVARNEYGTPLLNDAFAQAQQRARHRLMCYINADIILFPDFVRTVQRLRFPRFLMIGQRSNLDLEQPLDFSRPDWETRLRARVRAEGVLAAPAGSDYFVFVRYMLGELPPFVVGRPGWDNWMIFNARRLKMPVVDATRACVVVHQNHDYRHIRSAYRANTYDGPEADHNLRIMDGNRTRFIMLDATHIMTENTLLPAWSPRYLERRVRTFASLHPAWRPFVERLKRFRQKGKA